MKIKKYLYPVLLAGTGLALIQRMFAKTGSGRPASCRTDYDAIDEYVEQQMKRLSFPGVSLAIVEGDQIAHLRGFGRARPGGEPPTPQTPFFIGSLTKSFTAMAVMQLVEARKAALDAPVQQYLPWFHAADPAASAQITVRHLLNQTSGFPAAPGDISMADFDENPHAAERQARALSNQKLTHAPGVVCQYSNTNYNLLGLVIEAASGESYEDYIQNHIFDPLEMKHSYTSKKAAIQDGLAAGHRFWFWTPVAFPDLPVPRGSIASGELISCAEDMAHYLIAYLNGGCYGNVQVLSPESIAEMHHGAAEFRESGISFGSYGMGWIIPQDGSPKTIWHNGNTPDFTGYMALLPEEKKGIVLIINAGHAAMVPLSGVIGGGATSMLAGEKPNPGAFGIFLYIPWVMRSLLLIPLIQVAGVLSTLKMLSRLTVKPELHPSGGRLWGRHILLPLVPNLLALLAVKPVLGNLRGYLMLFLPDYFWTTLICGSFAGIWAILRTGLTLRALRKP